MPLSDFIYYLFLIIYLNFLRTYSFFILKFKEFKKKIVNIIYPSTIVFNPPRNEYITLGAGKAEDTLFNDISDSYRNFFYLTFEEDE